MRSRFLSNMSLEFGGAQWVLNRIEALHCVTNGASCVSGGQRFSCKGSGHALDLGRRFPINLIEPFKACGRATCARWTSSHSPNLMHFGRRLRSQNRSTLFVHPRVGWALHYRSINCPDIRSGPYRRRRKPMRIPSCLFWKWLIISQLIE